MKIYWVLEVWLQAFLTSVLDGGEWSHSHPDILTHAVRAPNIHGAGDWVGIRVSLDAVTKRNKPIIALPGNSTPVVHAIS